MGHSLVFLMPNTSVSVDFNVLRQTQLCIDNHDLYFFSTIHLILMNVFVVSKLLYNLLCLSVLQFLNNAMRGSVNYTILYIIGILFDILKLIFECRVFSIREI